MRVHHRLQQGVSLVYLEVVSTIHAKYLDHHVVRDTIILIKYGEAYQL